MKTMESVTRLEKRGTDSIEWRCGVEVERRRGRIGGGR